MEAPIDATARSEMEAAETMSPYSDASFADAHVAAAEASPPWDEPVDHATDDAAMDSTAVPLSLPDTLARSAADGEPLMSPATDASITSSFHTLAESVVLQDPELIERVLREAMRPLLKAWLDDHLPSIVERLVRIEIERVARGGRGRTA